MSKIIDKLKAAWAWVQAQWYQLPPWARRYLEGAMYTFGAAGGAVIWDALEHGGWPNGHVIHAAWISGLAALLLYFRTAPRDKWTPEQRAAANGH